MLDFATSIVAEGKVLVASQGGKQVPHGALVGPDGKLSGDPHLLYGDYTPTGPRDHSKGTGAIARSATTRARARLHVRALGGSLSGNGATVPSAAASPTACCRSTSIPRCSIRRAFPTDVAAYVDFVKAAKPHRRRRDRCCPGEPEARMRAKRPAEGVPLPDDTWAAIVETAR